MSVYFNQSSMRNGTKTFPTTYISGSRQSSNALSSTVITIIVITIGLLVISCVVFIFYMRRSKRRQNKDSSSFTSSSDSSSQNTIKDLPSQPVKTIAIPTEELKPVNSSVFVWKNSNQKQSNAKNIKVSMKTKPKFGHKVNKNITATKPKTTAVSTVPITAHNKHLKVTHKPVVKQKQNIKPKQQNVPKLVKKTTEKPKMFNKK